jgi:hypothetical protein
LFSYTRDQSRGGTKSYARVCVTGLRLFFIWSWSFRTAEHSKLFESELHANHPKEGS